MHSYYAEFDSESLWERVNDDSTYLFVRTPMMLELARRGDPKIMDLCESLLKSGEIEQWFVALKTLACLANEQACQRLIDLYQESKPHKRSYIVSYAAQTVGNQHQSEFKKMVLAFAATGTVDITGWTETSIKALRSVCKRLGIKVKSVKKPRQKSPKAPATLDEASSELFAPIRLGV